MNKNEWPVLGKITGPLVMIGFGSIGKGMPHLLERHFEFDRSRFVVIDPNDVDRALLDANGIRFVHAAVTRDGYCDLLTPLLTEGGGQGFCVNVSVDVSSRAVMEVCREVGALYIDTVAEPWAGFYLDGSAGPEARTDYAPREIILEAQAESPGGPTAVNCCGANPGLVSWLVKQALLNSQRTRASKVRSRRRGRNGPRSCSVSASRASTKAILLVAYLTSTFRNCQGSEASMFSGKNPGRPSSDVQSVYVLETVPR